MPSPLGSLSQGQRAALQARALPRRTQLPNRADPFDCTLCAARLNAGARHWWARWCAPPRTGTARRLVHVHDRRIGVLEGGVLNPY